MRTFAKSAPIWLAALLTVLVGFTFGSLVGLAIGISPWWEPGTYAVVVLTASLAGNLVLSRHLRNLRYDGNNRSRIFPAPTPDEHP